MTQLALPALGPWTSTSLTLTALLGTCTMLLVGFLICRRTTRNRSKHQPGTPAVRVAALAAVGCTAYSADTSWRFAADYLDMSGTTERIAMFAAAELALFATALLARQNLHGPKQAPGLPGTLTWVITAVQVIPAYAESGVVGGTVRAFVGPIMAALLWHQAMGIELRIRTPEGASHSVLARVGREARERLLSRLGIAARDRDASQITRDRATRKAVALASHLAEQPRSSAPGGEVGALHDGFHRPSPKPRWASTSINAKCCCSSSPSAVTRQRWSPSNSHRLGLLPRWMGARRIAARQRRSGAASRVPTTPGRARRPRNTPPPAFTPNSCLLDPCRTDFPCTIRPPLVRPPSRPPRSTSPPRNATDVLPAPKWRNCSRSAAGPSLRTEQPLAPCCGTPSARPSSPSPKTGSPNSRPS